MLRGLPKVNAEWGLVALARNMIERQAVMAWKSPRKTFHFSDRWRFLTSSTGKKLIGC
jgi:hypothetical protein